MPNRFDNMITCWDLTFDDSEASNSYNVGYVLGLVGPDYYVIEEIRAKMDLPKQVKHVKKLKADHIRSREVVIEKAANGPAVAKSIKKLVPGVILVRPEGSKEDRAESVTWLFEADNVIFPEDGAKPWAEEAVEEFVGFGPRAKFQDRVDALVHGLERMEIKAARRRKAALAKPQGTEKQSAWNIG